MGQSDIRIAKHFTPKIAQSSRTHKPEILLEWSIYPGTKEFAKWCNSRELYGPRNDCKKHQPIGCNQLMLRNYWTPAQRLQNSCQETTTKMTEYLSFILQCTTVIILGAEAYCLYSLLKIADGDIKELLLEVSYEPSESDVK